MISTVVWLALIDSFDPCVFAIYSALLISASMISIRKTVTMGSVFIVSVYIGYLLFGMLLRYVALSLPRYVLAIATALYGTIIFLHTIAKRGRAGDGNVCREDEIVCKIGRILRLDKFMNRGTVFTFLIGFIAAFTLFPCTAGMYIIFNVLTIELSVIEWLPIVLFYIAIFISPLILILLSFIGIIRFKSIHNILLSNQDRIKLIGSILLIAISMYVLVTSVPTAPLILGTFSK